MAKGRNHVKTAVLLPVQSKRDTNTAYVRAKPKCLDDGTVLLSPESFIAAAEFIRAADGKLPPKF